VDGFVLRITSLTTKGRGEAAGVVLLVQAGDDRYGVAVLKPDATALAQIIAGNRPETAEPIAIRLGDNSLKKMLRMCRVALGAGRRLIAS